ncbi:MAG: type II secretion system F family protein, partial [Phycisphaerae bacterium]
RAGEAAGVHTDALDELIRFQERRAALRRELVQALTYPAIGALVLIGACILMLTVVVPQFQALFASAGADLPVATRVLLAVSDFVTHRGGVLAGAVGTAAIALRLLWARPGFQLALGLAASRLPLIGRVYYYAGVVQFCRMYALLERAGLPILDTLRVVEQMLPPGPLRRLAGEMQKQIASGSSITATIEKRDVLPDVVEHMIAVGESAGRMDEMLAAAAAHYDDELRVQIRRMTTALEPLLTLVVSALVLGVALAIFQPLWRMNAVLLEH